MKILNILNVKTGDKKSGIYCKNKKINKLYSPFRCVKMNGKNNKIIIHSLKNIDLEKLKIKIIGSNNIIDIGENPKLEGNLWVRGNDNKITIGKNIYGIVKFYLGNKNKGSDENILTIGDNASIGGCTFKSYGKNASITIGNNCLISYNVEITNSDTHTIIDMNDNVLNNCENVVIGDEVWICQDARILKKAKISSHSVVGISSVVTKKFDEENIVIAGNPAKIVKKNIKWFSDQPD